VTRAAPHHLNVYFFRLQDTFKPIYLYIPFLLIAMQTIDQILYVEQVILGAVIHHPDTFRRLIVDLHPDFFQHNHHAEIVNIIHQLDAKQAPLDLLILSQLMRDNGFDNERVAYLRVLPTDNLPANRQDSYIDILKQQCERNSFHSLGQTLINRSIDPTYPTTEFYAEVDKEIRKLINLTRRISVQPLSQILSNYFNKTFNTETSAIEWFESGLNRVLGNFTKGDLVVVGGRPGMGKTSFMLTQALHTGMQQQKPLLYISLELSAQRIGEKLLTLHSGIPCKEWELMDAWPSERKDRFLDSVNAFTNAPIHVLDDATLNLYQICNIIRQYKAIHQIELVMVDYLQIVNSHKKHNIREQEISLISRTLKLLARELDIPIMVSSQLSRATERRGIVAFPMLSDLREGGSIEQDADKVLFVYRPEYYKITEYEDGSTTSGKAEIHVAKNRMGPIDSVRLIFDHTTQLFEADKEAPSYYRFGDFDFPPSRDDEFPPAPF